jgi:hypothetical protein
VQTECGAALFSVSLQLIVSKVVSGNVMTYHLTGFTAAYCQGILCPPQTGVKVWILLESPFYTELQDLVVCADKPNTTVVSAALIFNRQILTVLFK